jgi:hypothetical protein
VTGEQTPEFDEATEAELMAAADELDRIVAEVHERLTGGELERRREEIMRRVRERSGS